MIFFEESENDISYEIEVHDFWNKRHLAMFADNIEGAIEDEDEELLTLYKFIQKLIKGENYIISNWEEWLDLIVEIKGWYEGDCQVKYNTSFTKAHFCVD